LPGAPCANIAAGKATTVTTAMAVMLIVMVLASRRKNIARSLNGMELPLIRNLIL
jgi:hypothetical protein